MMYVFRSETIAYYHVLSTMSMLGIRIARVFGYVFPLYQFNMFLEGPVDTLLVCPGHRRHKLHCASLRCYVLNFEIELASRVDRVQPQSIGKQGQPVSESRESTCKQSWACGGKINIIRRAACSGGFSAEFAWAAESSEEE